MSQIPSIVDGPKLQVREVREYDIPCPKCSKDMRITSIVSGALIKCSGCKNITWRPDYVPPWWSKTSRFALSIIGSFLLGFLASIAASIAYEKYFHTSHVTPEPHKPSVLTTE